MAQEFTLAAHLWREITHIEFRVKRWHKKYEILNYIESHNFHLNYMLIKSNRNAIQTYKVEEHVLDTPQFYLCFNFFLIINLQISKSISLEKFIII